MRAPSSGTTRNATVCAFDFPFKGLVPDPLGLLSPPMFREPQAVAQGYELEGCWVLKPEGNSRKGVIHFLGGAFVGANPQISYSTLLEELSSLGFIVISTPYELTFNHSTCAFIAATKFDRCLEKLCIHPMGGGMPTEGFQELPIYTLGHSNGSLLHLLASSLESCAETSYSCVQRSVLMSYNNKPVEEAVPGGVPSGVSPLASQLLEYQSLLTPQIQEFMPMITDTPLGKQLLPYVNQLNQSVGELAEGTREFEPTPGESREIIKDGYCVPETLLVRFTDDSFDQSSEMANILSLSQKVASVELDEISGLGHLTPLGTTLEWEVGDKFTPLDAIAQAIRGEGTKRARSLALRISEWLLDAES